MEVDRSCYKCGDPISACMGYVKAGDFLEFMVRKRDKNDIREICGKCVLKYDKELLEEFRKEREQKA
jgi:hypothetical protein